MTWFPHPVGLATLMVAGGVALATAQEAPTARERATEAMTLGGDGPLTVETALESVDPRQVEVAIRVSGELPPSEPLMITACFGFLDIGDRCLDPFPTATPDEAWKNWEGTLIADLPDEPVAVGIYVATGDDTQTVWGTGSADASADLQLTLYEPQILDRRPPPSGIDPRLGGDAGPIRLVPPPQVTLSGTHRFRVMASDPRVSKVVFELDGEQVASDGSHPYSARINLGPANTQRTLVAIAYGDGDQELGRDEVVVNERLVNNRIQLRSTSAGGGRLEVEADVTLDLKSQLERVVFTYRGIEIANLAAAPFRASVDVSDAGPSDYIQAVATLADGSRIEDVLLLAAGGAGEQIEVHLTELYTVFFDRDTQEVLDDVAREAVELKVRGKPVPIERFARADERSITVGLVIDTSNSMYALIPDTQQAAGRFLSGVLRPNDSAFIVDFDTRPRLAHAVTNDRRSLISRLAVLTADGFTALFDSIVYSTLEFPADGRRRALVVLSDGDDYKSKLGPGNAIEYAEAAGSPVYIISLAGIHMSYQAFGPTNKKVDPVRKPDIEMVARETGGRVFYISSLDELPAAYDRILKELTNQYLITFSTPQELSEDERASIRVQPTSDAIELRFTVGRP